MPVTAPRPPKPNTSSTFSGARKGPPVGRGARRLRVRHPRLHQGRVGHGDHDELRGTAPFGAQPRLGARGGWLCALQPERERRGRRESMIQLDNNVMYIHIYIYIIIIYIYIVYIIYVAYMTYMTL